MELSTYSITYNIVYSIMAYLRQLQSFVDYCDTNFLELNVPKTKEMIIDFRRNTIAPEPVVIKGSVVDRISSYKYLGVVLNNKLTWGGSY